MERLTVTLEVTIELKDEHGATSDMLPSAAEVAALVNDDISDLVKADYETNWIVRNVRATGESFT